MTIKYCPDSFNKEVLEQRNKLLAETDWTQLPDVPENTKSRYKEYRQALRDITKQPGYPDNIIWPLLENYDP